MSFLDMESHHQRDITLNVLYPIILINGDESTHLLVGQFLMSFMERAMGIIQGIPADLSADYPCIV